MRRLLYWEDRLGAGDPNVAGDPLPDPPSPQRPPKQGTDPLVDPGSVKQLERDDDDVLGFVDSDGRPFLVPFTPQVVDHRIVIGSVPGMAE